MSQGTISLRSAPSWRPGLTRSGWRRSQCATPYLRVVTGDQASFQLAQHPVSRKGQWRTPRDGSRDPSPAPSALRAEGACIFHAAPAPLSPSAAQLRQHPTRLPALRPEQRGHAEGRQPQLNRAVPCPAGSAGASLPGEGQDSCDSRCRSSGASSGASTSPAAAPCAASSHPSSSRGGKRTQGASPTALHTGARHHAGS